jgi:hypothetical protein
MMLSSFTTRWVKEILLAFAFSLINPVVIALNFFFVFDKLATSIGTNTLAIPGRLIPVYIATGMGIYAAITSILFLAIQSTLKLPFSKFSSANALGHLVFVPFLLFSLQFISGGGMEWNVMGFIVAPLFLLVSLFSIPVSVAIALLRINKYRHKQ